MTCCNHQCREGRDCPARRTRYLPDLGRALIVVTAALLASAGLLGWVL